MSTLQNTPRHGDRTTTRPVVKVLALSMLAAIGLALVILLPTTQHTATPTGRHIPRHPALTAQTPGITGCFRDPVTHALRCSHTAPSPVANRAPADQFRDPLTHKLLRLPRQAAARAGQHPTNHSRGRIIP